MYISSYSLEDDPPEAIQECINAFKEKFFGELFNGWETQKGKFWVAGGCLRNYWENTEPRDIDIYTVDSTTRQYVMSSLMLVGAVQVADSIMSTVYELDGLQFDVIKKHFNGPEETLWDFDLSPALCATDGESLFYEEHYFLNLADRSLVLHNAKGGNTIERIIRYSQQGFTMSKGQVKKLISELGIEDTQPDFSNSAPLKVALQPTQLSSPVSKSKLSFKKIWPKKKDQIINLPHFTGGWQQPNVGTFATPNTGGGFISGGGSIFQPQTQYPMYTQVGAIGTQTVSAAQTQMNIPVGQIGPMDTMTAYATQPGGGEVEDQPF